MMKRTTAVVGETATIDDALKPGATLGGKPLVVVAELGVHKCKECYTTATIG